MSMITVMIIRISTHAHAVETEMHTYIYIHASRVSAKVGQQAKPASALPKDQLQLPTPKCLLVHQALFLVKRAGSCF